MEVLKYATALDLNIGYYAIRIFPASQEMTAIATDLGKFKYNRLSMGMWYSRDIFQDKLDLMLDDIGCVKTYIDDILVLRREIFYNHIEQMIKIFGILHTAGLRANATKCIFVFNDIPYLGYVIAQEGIISDSNKV